MKVNLILQGNRDLEAEKHDSFKNPALGPIITWSQYHCNLCYGPNQQAQWASALVTSKRTQRQKSIHGSLTSSLHGSIFCRYCNIGRDSWDLFPSSRFCTRSSAPISRRLKNRLIFRRVMASNNTTWNNQSSWKTTYQKWELTLSLVCYWPRFCLQTTTINMWLSKYLDFHWNEPQVFM